MRSEIGSLLSEGPVVGSEMPTVDLRNLPVPSGNPLTPGRYAKLGKEADGPTIAADTPNVPPDHRHLGALAVAIISFGSVAGACELGLGRHCFLNLPIIHHTCMSSPCFLTPLLSFIRPVFRHLSPRRTIRHRSCGRCSWCATDASWVFSTRLFLVSAPSSGNSRACNDVPV